MKKQFLAVTGVAAAMGAALATAALRGAKEIDKAAKSAKRLDSSIGGFRALELAADEAGVSLSGLTNDIQTMNRELASIGTSGNGQRALDALNLSLSDLKGLDADEKLAVIADQVKELGLSSGQTTAILRDLGVRNREMALLVLEGGDAIRSARTDIRDYGLEISAVDAAAIEKANDQIGRLGLITQYAGQQLAQEMVPALGAMAQAMTDSLKAGGLLRAMIDGLVDNISTIAGSTAVLVGVLGVKLAAAMATAAGATGVLTGAFVLLKRAIFATGFGAIVIGAGYLVGKFADLVKATGGFGNAMSLLGDVAGAVWRGMIDSAAAIPPALNGVWERMKGGFLIALSGMATAFFDFVWTIANGLQQVPGLDLIGDQLMGVADAADAASGSLMRSGLAAQASASGSFSKAADTISTAFDPARKAVQSLSDAVSATTTEIEGGGDATNRLNNALDETGGAGGKAAKALEKVKTEAEAYNAALKDAALTSEDIGTEKANIMIGGIDGVANAFGDFIGGGLKDFKGFVKSILSSFTGMISKMVAMAAKNKIMIGLGIGGTTGGGTSTGGLGGIGDLLKGGSIFGKTGIFGTMGSSFGTSLGGILGGQGSALASSLGGLGASIGAAIPIIGIAAAAFSFFKTKTTELNAGLRVTTTGMTALVDTFKTLEKVKFWGLSKKVSTTYEMASADIADPIQSAITQIGQTVIGLSDVLGLASDNLQNTSFEFEVSTKDKSDAEIQEAITAEMTRLGNSFADAVIGSYTEFLPDEAEIARLDGLIAGTYNIGGRGGEDAGAMRRAALEQQRITAETAIEVVHLNGALAGLQREGEGSLEMLERIVGNLYGVNEALYLFDRAALEMSVSGATAATALVDLSGGLEAFSAKTQFVFENMLTDAAQEMRLTEIASAKLNSTLGALGIAIPETHAEFMAMLDGQDLMTEAGRNTHAALLDVASAFVQVNGTAQAAADAITAQAAAAAQAAQKARAAEVAAGLAVTQARADAANSAMADADAMLRAAFAAERERLSGSQTTSIDTTSISARVGLFNTIRDALERAYADRRVLTALGQKMRLADATAFLRSAVAAGGTSDADRLEAALDAVADPSTALFKSFADYQHDYNVNTNLIERLKGLTDDSLSVEEKTLKSMESQSSILQSNNASQLAALDAQMNALLGIDTSVLSVADAIAGYKAAQDAVAKAVDTQSPASTQFAAGSFGEWLNGIYLAELGREVKSAGLDFYGGHYADGLSKEAIHQDILGSAEREQYKLTGIPSYASGTDYHPGGMAQLHQNELVNLPRGTSVSTAGEVREMVSELKALRQSNTEMATELRAIRRFAQSRTDIVEDQRAEELAAGSA